MHVFVLTYYDIFWPLCALTSKRSCFILAHNIRLKFGRTFGTRSVSLPKPSASAECHNLTFGPSLIVAYTQVDSPISVDLTVGSSLVVFVCFAWTLDRFTHRTTENSLNCLSQSSWDTCTCVHTVELLITEWLGRMYMCTYS